MTHPAAGNRRVSPVCCWLLFAGVVYLPGGLTSPAWGQVTDSAAPRDVRAFGARGDGQADDTAAIQRAVDSKVGAIVFPRGSYRLTRSITIDLDQVGFTAFHGSGVAQLVMAGPGPALRFRGTHQKSADPNDVTPSVWERQRAPLVDGLGIVGAHPEADGIEADGTMQLTVTRVHGRKLRHVVHLVGSNRNVAIADCHFYENRGCGVFYDNVNLHQSNITGCHISYNAGGGIVSLRGNVRNIHITGCDIESNMTPDAPATANVLIDSQGSGAGTGEVAITGCTIQHNNPSPDSANIRILGRSAPSARLAVVQEGNVTITGNVLSDVQVNIHLKDCRGVTVTGNTIWQGYRHNLLLEDCVAVVVSGNNLDRSPRYNYGNTQQANNSIVVRRCADSLLTGLVVSQVWRDPAGILLEDCRRCTVSQSTILDCDQVGLLVRNSSLCRITDCMIRDDRDQAKSQSLVLAGGKGNLVADNVLSFPLQNEAAATVERNNVVIRP